jgi:hypothetical protein
MIVDLDQGSPEWKAFRATRRMASESVALLRLSPWFPRTPFELWEVKPGLSAFRNNPGMARGRELEATAHPSMRSSGPISWCRTSSDGEADYAASLDGLSFDE